MSAKKDAEIRKCTQQSIQGRSVKTHCPGNFFGCFRTALNLIGEPQVCRQANNIRGKATRHQMVDSGHCR
jgi:hypothetical protein